MNIKKEYVEKFKKLYEKTFNEKITPEEAFEQCLKLVLLLNAVYEPMTADDLKRVKSLIKKSNEVRA